MTKRTLTLAIRLLTAAVIGAAFIGVEAGCCENPWNHPVDFKLDTDADLNDVALGGLGFIIATADGQLIQASNHGETWDPVVQQDSVEYAGPVPLNAVAIGDSYLVTVPEYWVVGDQGLLLHKPEDGAWETIDLGTSARLADILFVHDQWIVIVGDGVVRTRSLSESGGDWISPLEPEDGWGDLRAVFGDGERIWAVGANGAAWVSSDPTTTWEREDTDLGNVNLNGGGLVGYYGRAVIVGDGGTMAWFDGARWWAKHTGVDVDLLDYAGGIALGRDGRLFEANDGELRRVDKAEGLNRALVATDLEYGVMVVGEGGRGRWFHGLDSSCT
jgi:hypothetical protein